jgi:cobalt-precorrin 5A hydrolase
VNAESLALITLSDAGARLLAPLAAALPGARLYLHESVRDEALGTAAGGSQPDPTESDGQKPDRSETILSEPTRREAGGAPPPAARFTKIADLTATLFRQSRGLVYAAPVGVVVRAVAPLVRNKFEDPAVVVLDAGGRWAVSLLSGHEGGANILAIRVANILGAEPVITTTTEALKSVIVGIGCRRGSSSDRIVQAIRAALAEADVPLDEVRLIASADIKADEPGLITAGEALDIPIRFIPAAEIRESSRAFSHSDFVKEKVNLPAVAEPAALLAGRRTRFILRKRTYNGITIALAREGL